MVGNDVKLIIYSKRVDRFNCLTHAVPALLFAAGGFMSVCRAAKTGSTRVVFSDVIYSLSLVAVYAVSAFYHGLPPGEAKRRARLLDHSTIPFLIAGTATPCSLITLYAISKEHAYFVFFLSWFCVLFGVFSKVFFFEKLKVACMVIYIAGGAAMMLSTLPLLGGGVNPRGFLLLTLGCVFYLIGALFCRFGINVPWLHIVFHIFVALGSAVHFYVLYTMVF